MIYDYVIRSNILASVDVFRDNEIADLYKSVTRYYPSDEYMKWWESLLENDKQIEWDRLQDKLKFAQMTN